MGWFAVDDGFDNHPKVRKAGNAAAGLFCRLGAYSKRHNTEGVIPGSLARDYGTAAQIRKLGELSMLHGHGHACPRCPQPEPGDFVMHDFLDCNQSREEVNIAKAAGAERQRRRRARLAEEAAQADLRVLAAKTVPPSGPPVGGSSGRPLGGSSGPPSGPPVSGMHSRSEAPVTADAAGERARSTQPNPSCSSNEEQEQTKDNYNYGAGAGDRLPAVRGAAGAAGVAVRQPPEWVQPLLASLEANGLGDLAWDFRGNEELMLANNVQRLGVERMVKAALTAARTAGGVSHARFFFNLWTKIPNVAVNGNTPQAVHRTSTTDDRVNQAITLGRQMQAAADAQKAGN